MADQATDTIYRERSHLVAHLAAIYPSSLTIDPAEPDWPVVLVSLPTGQVSWHVAPEDMDLFGHVHMGSAMWDGHDTAEKYRRLDEHARQVSRG